jgi:hypothetical protein
MRTVVKLGFMFTVAPLLCGQDLSLSLKATVELLGYRVCVVNHEYSLPEEHGISADAELRLRYRITLHNPTQSSVELKGWEPSPDYAIAKSEKDAWAGNYLVETNTDSSLVGAPPTSAANQFARTKKVRPGESLQVKDDIQIVLWSLGKGELNPGQDLYLRFWVKLEPTGRSSPTFHWWKAMPQPTEPIRFQLPDDFQETVTTLTEQLNRKKIIADKELCSAERH